MKTLTLRTFPVDQKLLTSFSMVILSILFKRKVATNLWQGLFLIRCLNKILLHLSESGAHQNTNFLFGPYSRTALNRTFSALLITRYDNTFILLNLVEYHLVIIHSTHSASQAICQVISYPILGDNYVSKFTASMTKGEFFCAVNWVWKISIANFSRSLAQSDRSCDWVSQTEVMSRRVLNLKL